MMTDSQKSFVQVKLWFSKLVNHSPSIQLEEITLLHENGTLDNSQVKLLKDMLQADVEDILATNIQSASENLASLASSENQILEQKQIGPYKIIKPLGEGGMGQVYLAERNDGTFEQQVALKLPHFNFNSKMLQRFENERQILAQLTHINIAHLLDGGTTENNQPYLVMEYIQGQNIDNYCIDKVPSLHERLKLILQICAAVTFSHQQLVLHRDLKPSNILVTEASKVKLLDFGIAKLLDLDDEAIAKQTATQIMTRYYASPEQLQGKSASTHSDLFSLAIIAYELITGYHPFQHKDQHEREQNLISGKIMRVTQRTKDTEALSPELAKIPAGKLQGDLENILLKALSVDPSKRYESVKDFADDLKNFIENKPVSARKPSQLYSFNKFIQRNKFAALAFLIALISLFTGSGLAIWKAKQALEQKVIAQNQQQKAELESEKATQIADFLKNLFKKARPSKTSAELTAQDLLDQGIKQLKTDSSIIPENKYDLITIIFKSYMQLDKFNELKIAVDGVYDSCINELSPSHPKCQETLVFNALTEHRLNNDELAIEYFQKAEDIARNNQPINKATLANILRNQFSPLINLGQIDLAIEKTQEGLNLYSMLPENSPTMLIVGKHNLAFAAIFNQKFSKAKDLIDEISSDLINNNLQESVYSASHYNLMAIYQDLLHEPNKAITERVKAIKITNDLFPDQPSLLGVFLSRHAYILNRVGRTDDAIETYNKAIKYYQKHSKSQKYKITRFYIYKTLIYLQTHNIENAKNEFNYVKQLLINNPTEMKTFKCNYYLADAQLAILSESTETALNKLRILKKCTFFEKHNEEFVKIYTQIIDAQMSLKLSKYNDAKSSISTAENFFDKYPNDYIGLRKLVDSIKIEIKRNQVSE